MRILSPGLLSVCVSAALSGGVDVRHEMEVVESSSRGYIVATDDQLKAHLLDDLNGDGRPDLVYQIGAGSSTRIAFQQADGSFGKAVDFSPAITEGIVAVDLDGDGAIDLITPGRMHPVSAPDEWQSLPGEGSCIAAGDLNGDGRIDLVSGAHLMLNGGDLAFTTTSIGFDGQRWIADMDDDGDCDVIDQSHVYFNDGSGNLTAVPIGLDTLEASPRAIGDFNGDGLPDIAAWVSRDVVIGLSNGDGSFRESARFEPEIAGGVTDAVVRAADMNHGGATDLILLHRSFTWFAEPYARPLFFAGDGTGSFAERRELATGGLIPGAIMIGDVNGDTWPDMVTDHAGMFLGQTPVGTDLVVALNGRDEAMFPVAVSGAQLHTELRNGTVTGVIAADLSGNGATDIGVAFADHVRAFFGDSTRFSDVEDTLLPSVADATVVTSADMTGDGQAEFIYGNYDGLVRILKTIETPLTVSGYALVSHQVISGLELPLALAPTDVDGDGDTDLIIGTSGFAHGEVHVFMNESGQLAIGATYVVPGPVGAMQVGDMNRDNRPDIVFAMDSTGLPERGPAESTVQILIQDGSGGFAAAMETPPSVSGGVRSLVLDDFDLDRDLDVAVASRLTSRVTLLRWDAGDLAAEASFVTPFELRSIESGDIDRDGVPELVMSSWGWYSDQPPGADTRNRLFVYDNDGSGVFTQSDAILFPASPTAMTLKDIDGDRRLDFVAGCDTFECAAVMFNATPIACPGDTNGDDRVDMADLEWLLSHWGDAVSLGTGGDVDGDEHVDFADLNLLLDAWGSVCDG